MADGLTLSDMVSVVLRSAQMYEGVSDEGGRLGSCWGGGVAKLTF
jgi:hypothetical protein